MQTAAAAWVNANCAIPTVRSDLLHVLSEASLAGVDCWVLIGGGLISSGAATLLHCFAGELFAFQLTDAQAALQANGITIPGTTSGLRSSRRAFFPAPGP